MFNGRNLIKLNVFNSYAKRLLCPKRPLCQMALCQTAIMPLCIMPNGVDPLNDGILRSNTLSITKKCSHIQSRCRKCLRFSDFLETTAIYLTFFFSDLNEDVQSGQVIRRYHPLYVHRNSSAVIQSIQVKFC